MWLIFALLNPISEAIRSVIAKKLTRNIDSIYISLANNVLPLIFFFPALFFIELKFNLNFFIGLFGSGLINIATAILYMKAIEKSDISKVMPMLSFTPLFLLVTSPVILGETIHLLGILGIIFVVIGSYLLNLDLSKNSVFEPFKGLLREKGTRYMLIVSFLWSFSANFDKLSIQNSSILQHIIFVNIIIVLGVWLIIYFWKGIDFGEIKREIKGLSLISFFTTLAFIFHMTALSLTYVAYVVSFKRMSGLIAVFLGYFLLGEGKIKERFLGSFVMFIGVLLIALS